MAPLIFSDAPTRLPSHRGRGEGELITVSAKRALLLHPLFDGYRLIDVPTLHFGTRLFPLLELILGSTNLVLEKKLSVLEVSGEVTQYVVYHHEQSARAPVNQTVSAMLTESIWRGPILVMKVAPGFDFLPISDSVPEIQHVKFVLERFLLDATGTIPATDVAFVPESNAGRSELDPEATFEVQALEVDMQSEWDLSYFSDTSDENAASDEEMSFVEHEESSDASPHDVAIVINEVSTMGPARGLKRGFQEIEGPSSPPAAIRTRCDCQA
ncbi:hypothetical protein CC2G_002908 [Coprinopsis cinerea AmutBmut pab1-1]|nr:hypothetical protein CC2G_002908 [Coprinopsis cinerea AmutBmut pab1-1]